MLGYSLVIEDKFDQARPAAAGSGDEARRSNGAAHALYGLCMLRRGFITQGREHLERGKRWRRRRSVPRVADARACRSRREPKPPCRWRKEIIAGAGGNRKPSAASARRSKANSACEPATSTAPKPASKTPSKRTDPKLRSAVELSQAQLRMARKDWPKAKTILDEVKQDENFAYRAYATESPVLQQNGETPRRRRCSPRAAADSPTTACSSLFRSTI